MSVTKGLNFSQDSLLLTLVATPIGNLEDMSPRGIKALSEADDIFCEDTRNTEKLLSCLKIGKKNLHSCHDFNEEEESNKAIELIKEGKKVCYASDAGYPLVSDPGSRLVAKALENDIRVSVVPGPCAAINALVCSGLDSEHFYFEGFLPPKEKARNDELRELSERKETLIFYESPHRITKTLVAMCAVFGPRKAVIARELTKVHEEFIRGTLPELAILGEDELRGEMVIIVEGKPNASVEVDDNMICLALRDELEFERSGKEAVENVAKNMGVKKNRVYAIYLKTFKDNN